MSAPRMRTYQAAAALIRELDPDTCVTPYRLRAWILDGTIPHVRAGNKYLINVDLVLEVLAGKPELSEPEQKTGIIRPVELKVIGR